MTFPEQLKAYRESNSLSQAKLAEFLAVSPRAVWQWEQGQLPHILMQEGALVRMGAERERMNPLYVVHPTKGVSLAEKNVMPHLKEYTPEERKASGDAFREGSKQRTLAMNSVKAREESELLKRLENPQLKKK